MRCVGWQDARALRVARVSGVGARRDCAALHDDRTRERSVLVSHVRHAVVAVDCDLSPSRRVSRSTDVCLLTVR